MDVYHLLDAVFPFIVLFYALDSVVLVKPFQCVFYRSWARFRVKSKGVVLAGLAPTSRVFVSLRPPIYLTVGGVYAQRPEFRGEYAAPAPDRFRLIPYETIEEVRVDNGTLFIDDVVKIRLRSSEVAHRIAERIESVRGADPVGRKKKVEGEWRSPLDLGAVDDTLKRHDLVGPVLRTGSTVFFVLLFGVLPAVLYTPLITVVPLTWVLEALLGACGLVAAVVVAKRRDLFPAEGRWTHMLSVVLSPVTLAHISTHVDKERLVQFDPLVLAARFLPVREFADAARRELGRLEMLGRQYPDHALRGCWKERERALHGLIAARGLTVESVREAVHQEDPAAIAYCVVCGAEYEKVGRRCSECEIELMPYRAGP